MLRLSGSESGRAVPAGSRWSVVSSSESVPHSVFGGHGRDARVLGEETAQQTVVGQARRTKHPGACDGAGARGGGCVAEAGGQRSFVFFFFFLWLSADFFAGRPAGKIERALWWLLKVREAWLAK